MPKYKYSLKPGSTFACALDAIEGEVVTYMKGRRGIDESTMRNLLESDAEVRASYRRKIERSIQGAIAQGYDPACFGRKA